MENKTDNFWERKLEILKEEQKKGIEVRLIRDEGGYVYMMYGLKIPEPIRKGMMFMGFNSSPALVVLQDGVEVPSNKVIDWGLDGYPEHLEQPIDVKEVIKQRCYWEYTYNCSICGEETRNSCQPVGTFNLRTEGEICLLCQLKLDVLKPLVKDNKGKSSSRGMGNKILIGSDNILWKVGNIYGYDVQKIKIISLDGTIEDEEPLAIRMGDVTSLIENREIELYQNVHSVTPIGKPTKLKPTTIISEPNHVERLGKLSTNRVKIIKQYIKNANGIGDFKKLEDLLFKREKKGSMENIEAILDNYQTEDINRYYTGYVTAYKVLNSSTGGKSECDYQSIRLDLSKGNIVNKPIVNNSGDTETILVTYKGVAFRYDRFIEDLKSLAKTEPEYMGKELADRILNLPKSTEVITSLKRQKSKIKLEVLDERGGSV